MSFFFTPPHPRPDRSSPVSSTSSPSTSSYTSPYSSISSASSSSSSSPWSNSSTSPITPRTRFFLGRPSPVPLRRPLLPTQWTHPITSTIPSTTVSLSTSTTTLNTTTTPPPVSPVPATPCPLLSPIPSSSSITTQTQTHTTTTKLNDPPIPSFSALTRPRQHQQQQNEPRKFSVSAPCTPLMTRHIPLFSTILQPSPLLSQQQRQNQTQSRQQQQQPQNQKLVFTSGAVGTASALGHVFGRPLQNKETTPCTPLNCAQLRNDPHHPLLHQQAQCPSHIFQQQCQVHKRFRLFRQRPRRCQVHNTSATKGPNYIFPPTTVHPLVVRPEKILLEHFGGPSSVASSSIYESWRATALTTSESTSSRLSSYSTTSLSPSTGSYNQGSDSESYNNGNLFRSSKKKKNKETSKHQLRCLCYLNSSTQESGPSGTQQTTGSIYLSQQQSLQSSPSLWHPQKHQHNNNKEASRLRRMWNDSTIFHWSKPSSMRQQGQEEDQLSQQQPQPHDITLTSSPQAAVEPQLSLSATSTSDTSMEHTRQPSPAEHQMGGVPMRMSLSGTDTSDGNLSYSDIDDDLLEDRRILHQRVSFKDHSQGSRRAKEDMRAIARQQAEASLEGYKDYEAFKTGNQALRINRQQQQQAIVIPSDLQMTRPQAQAFIQTDDEDDYDEDDDHHHHHHHHHSEEEDDDEEDWDIQSDSGAPSSSPMYSAEAQKPTSYSTVTLPMSAPIGLSASSKKKPSNAALNSLRSRQRCLSLPADNALPPGFFKMPSTPSENWDEDFDIGSSDINVPTQVVESQISLQMDIYNIKDFASQIEDLKNLRASLRLASSSAKARNPKKHQDLSMLFQRDWEQAEVIIDLGEIAQTSTSMTTSATSATSTGPFQQPQQQQLAAGPLSLVSGKGVHYPLSPPRLTTKKSNHFNSRSKASWSRRSALASVTGTSSSPPPLPKPQPFYLQQQHQPPREPTPPAGIPIRTTSLTAQSRTLSQSSSLTGTTLAGSLDEDTCTAVDEEEEFKDRQYRPLTVDTEAAVEGTAISSRHRILSPKSWRRKSSETSTTSTVTPKDISSPLTPLPDGLSLSGGFGNGHGSPEEMEASFRRYQKSCHQQQHRHTYNYAPTAAGNGVVHSSSMPSPSRLYQKQRALEADEDTAGDDDGYESYGRPLSSSNTSSGGGGPSVGVITPIPSDRHMQVLKDILMEGLGSDVARQYMFKQGEQDHVRFSVEVIPGLLGHLKGLQRRLGDQLLELQQLTVIV